MNLGEWQIDDLLTFCVQLQSFSTGAATDGDSAPTYRVYEDETGTPILTGTMALLDDANTTGFYSEQITLSAANGFEVGKCYSIRIAATVGGVSSATLRFFQMEEAKATAAQATAIEADTQDIQSRLPAALVSGRMDSYVGAMANNVITSSVVATNAFNNSAFTTGYFNSINAEVDTALADYDAPTKAELDAAETAIIAAIPDIAPLEANVTAVKAKTDNLTFTVAGQVDANTESINGATVNGNGTSGNLWRGA